MRSVIACIAAAVLLSSCVTVDTGSAYFTEFPSTANVYVAPGPSPIDKVAVMPFKASTELIGASVSDLFVTELLKAGRYTLVERSQMARVLGETELAMANLSESKALEVGHLLGADGIIIGTVDEYLPGNSRSRPSVALSVRLIDCQSGKVMWSADLASRAEDDLTISQHARSVVHDIMAGIYQKWVVQPKSTARRAADASAALNRPPTAGLAPTTATTPPTTSVVRSPTPSIGTPAVTTPVATVPSPVTPAGPAVPAGFSVGDLGLRTVVIKWTPPASAAGLQYRIERAEKREGPFSQAGLAPASAGLFSDKGGPAPLKDGATYYYRLAAVSSSGVESRPTEIKESMTAPPPEPASGLKAESPAARTVQLKWTASPSEGISKYLVERADESAATAFTPAGESTTTVFKDTSSTLKDGARYRYRVIAVNAGGASSVGSDAAVVTLPGAGPAVTGLTASRDRPRSIVLSWNVSTDPTTTAYEIERRKTGTGPYASVAKPAGRQQNTWTDRESIPSKPIENGTEFDYRIRSLNAVGLWSDWSADVAGRAKPRPSPPSDLMATPIPTGVQLAWKASSSPDIAEYVVLARGQSEPLARTSTNGCTLGFSVLKGGLTASVVARDRDGLDSDPVPIAVKEPGLAAPTGLTAGTVLPREISLSWTASPNPTVTAYEIERRAPGATSFVSAGKILGRDKNAWSDRGSSPAGPLTDGAEHAYRIRCVTAAGAVSSWSAEIAARSKACPPPPSHVTVSYFSGGIALAWKDSPAADLSDYVVYKKGGDGVLAKSPTNGCAIGFAPLKGGSVLLVRAKDRDGLESQPATIAVDEPAPPVPTGLSANTNGLREVVLRWPLPKDNASQYRLERSPSPAGPFSPVGTAAAASGTWRDAGAASSPLADSTAYSYRAVAIGSNGRQSDPGPVVTGLTAPPPEPPTGLTASTPAARAVKLAWKASTSEGVVKYVVERTTADAPDAFARLTVTDKLEFSEGGSPQSPLKDSTEYLYRVTSINRVGSIGAPSVPVKIVTRPPPAVVQGLTARDNEVRNVPLAWKSSPEDDIVRYDLYRRDEAGGEFKRLVSVKGREKNTFLDGAKDPGNLADAHEYAYKIRAVNAVLSESADSPVVTVVTRPPPPVVTGLKAVSGRPREVPISWAASSDDKVVAYKILRSDTTPPATVTLETVEGRDTTAYNDRGGARSSSLGRLADGTTYTYAVVAINTAEATSKPCEGATAATKPVPVRISVLSATTNLPRAVRIEWKANPEKDIAQYLVESSPTAAGRFRPLAKIESSAADTLTFTDTEEPDGVERFYRIRAVDRDTLESEWSDTMAGATKPLPPPPTGLKAAWSGDGADLEWKAADRPDIQRYKIWKKGFIGSDVVATVSDTKARLESNKIGRKVTLFITAVDADNLESERSETVDIRAPTEK